MKIKQLLDEAKKGVKAPVKSVKPRNFVAKNAIATTSGAGAHKDKKKAAKQGDVKHKGKEQELAEGAVKTLMMDLKSMTDKEFVNKYKQTKSEVRAEMKMKNETLKESFNPEYDDEAGMADNNLETLKRAVEGLDDMINEGDNLPEWCQEKIAVAKSMLISVWDYMQSEENSMSENQRNPDLMSPNDYDRYQQGQMDQQKRDFKRDELEHELGHEERGMYYVVIAKNGKWEHTKAQPRQEGMNAAQRIINALHSKYPNMHLGMVGPDGKVYNYGKGR